MATLLLLAFPSPVLSADSVPYSVAHEPVLEATTSRLSTPLELIALKSSAAGLGATSTIRLQAIAKCESNYRQFNSDGTLYVGEVNPADVGIFQINTYYHTLKAVKALGYDLTTLDDNIDFAILLFKWQGSTPWFPSRPCWNKPNPGWDPPLAS